MPQSQRTKLAPPLDTDREFLRDYTSVLQNKFDQLFSAAHKHTLRTTVPASNEGNVGDIFLVESGSTFSLYVKFPSGWKSTVLT